MSGTQGITGYRALSPDEIVAINEIKELGAQLDIKIKHIQSNLNIDKRWLAIGITDLQKGFMAVIRSIAQPTSF